jgi:TusA-related sulfurtransferase
LQKSVHLPAKIFYRRTVYEFRAVAAGKGMESFPATSVSFRLASALLIAMSSWSQYEPMELFDFRNALIPFSLLDIRQRFKEMRPGDTFVVLWSDPAAADDLVRVLPAACVEIVSTGEIPDPSGGVRVELIKTR